MWTVIAAAIPWKTIFSGVVWIILRLVDKGEERKDMKKKFMQFIDEVDKSAPLKIRANYRKQIFELRKEILGEEQALRQLKISEENYRKNFQQLYAQHLKASDELNTLKAQSNIQ